MSERAKSYISHLREAVGSHPIIIVGSSIIVQNESKQLLLVLRADNKCWALPAGLLEPGESVEDCARRELMEETGLQAGNMELLRISSGSEMYYKYPNGDEVYIVSISYRCTEFSGEARVNDHESTDIGYFDLDSLPNPLNPPSQVVIEKLKLSGQL